MEENAPVGANGAQKMTRDHRARETTTKNERNKCNNHNIINNKETANLIAPNANRTRYDRIGMTIG